MHFVRNFEPLQLIPSFVIFAEKPQEIVVVSLSRLISYLYNFFTRSRFYYRIFLVSVHIGSF